MAFANIGELLRLAPNNPFGRGAPAAPSAPMAPMRPERPDEPPSQATIARILAMLEQQPEYPELLEGEGPGAYRQGGQTYKPGKLQRWLAPGLAALAASTGAVSPQQAQATLAELQYGPYQRAAGQAGMREQQRQRKIGDLSRVAQLETQQEQARINAAREKRIEEAEEARSRQPQAVGGGLIYDPVNREFIRPPKPEKPPMTAKEQQELMSKALSGVRPGDTEHFGRTINWLVKQGVDPEILPKEPPPVPPAKPPARGRSPRGGGASRKPSGATGAQKAAAWRRMRDALKKAEEDFAAAEFDDAELVRRKQEIEDSYKQELAELGEEVTRHIYPSDSVGKQGKKQDDPLGIF